MKIEKPKVKKISWLIPAQLIWWEKSI